MKKKIVVYTVISLWSFTLLAQPSNANKDLWDGKSPFGIEVLGYHQLPKAIDFKGSFLQALQWTDSQGENLLILSRNGWYAYPYNSKCIGSEEQTCFWEELFAYLFIKTGEGYQKQWRVFDYLDQRSGRDFNNDGKIDLVVANVEAKRASGTHSLLYINQNNNQNNWISVLPEGTQNNKDGYGCIVKVVSGDRSWIREISGGRSYLSNNSN